MAIALLGTRTGVVTSFDDHRGLGTIADDEGTVFDFHCAAIADGTRTIEVDARVRFAVVAGHLGRWEAGEITPA
ncbi:MAG: cold shock domain-containing protein [Acidimicrobiales bacterium]|nr:cold shock domain-containing protein [Acidimicrobiales bacterium]